MFNVFNEDLKLKYLKNIRNGVRLEILNEICQKMSYPPGKEWKLVSGLEDKKETFIFILWNKKTYVSSLPIGMMKGCIEYRVGKTFLYLLLDSLLKIIDQIVEDLENNYFVLNE